MRIATCLILTLCIAAGSDRVSSAADTPEIYHWRILAQRCGERKEYAQAIPYLNKLLELSPDDKDALRGRAMCYRSLGEEKRAMFDLEHLVKVGPIAQDYAALGEVYRELKQPELAVQAYTQGIKLSKYPSLTVGGYHGRATAYEAMHQYAKAVAEDTQAFKLDPHEVRVVTHRAKLYELLGQNDSAIADWTRAIQLYLAEKSDATSAFVARAKLYTASKKYDLAIKDWTDVIQHGKNASVIGYRERSKCYQLIGKPDLAKKDLDCLKQIEKDF